MLQGRQSQPEGLHDCQCAKVSIQRVYMAASCLTQTLRFFGDRQTGGQQTKTLYNHHSGGFGPLWPPQTSGKLLHFVKVELSPGQPKKTRPSIGVVEWLEAARHCRERCFFDG